MSDQIQNLLLANELVGEIGGGKSLYERYGGRDFLERLNSVFYDKVYADPWLSGFFADVSQKHIESQQSDFLAQLTGGPKNFCGRMPVDAHVHVMITEELFLWRHQLLKDSLQEIRTPDREKNELLKIDMAFSKVLIKANLSECKPRYKMGELLNIPRPLAKAS